MSDQEPIPPRDPRPVGIAGTADLGPLSRTGKPRALLLIAATVALLLLVLVVIRAAGGAEPGSDDTLRWEDLPTADILVAPYVTGSASPSPSQRLSPSASPTAPATTPASTSTRAPATQPSTRRPNQTIATYSNTAAFTNIADGASVDRCEWLAGRSSLAPTKTLFTAHRRTSPNDGTYYFFYIDNYEDGAVPGTWTTRTWFGSSPYGHHYDLFLLIMDVGDARAFWTANQIPSGAYADAPAIPNNAVVADQRSVVQTTIADC